MNLKGRESDRQNCGSGGGDGGVEGLPKEKSTGKETSMWVVSSDKDDLP